MKTNNALLLPDHYLWKTTLSNAAFGRVRSFQRFDGNYVYARSVQNGTTTTWDQNVVKEITKSASQQLITSRQQRERTAGTGPARFSSAGSGWGWARRRVARRLATS